MIFCYFHTCGFQAHGKYILYCASVQLFKPVRNAQQSSKKHSLQCMGRSADLVFCSENMLLDAFFFSNFYAS